MKIAGIKLQDASYMPKKDEIPRAAGEATAERRYPSLYVDDREMPAIRNKEIKDKCLLVAVINVRRRVEETEKEGDKEVQRVRMDFEILKAGLKPYDGGADDDLDDVTDEQLDERLKPEKRKAT